MRLFLFFSPFFCTLLVSCSLYESGGREAIEKNQSGIVGGFNTFNKKLTHYSACNSTYEEPEFLKAPLEVIETSYENEDISVFYSGISSPRWLAVYRYDSILQLHSHCKIYSLSGLSLNPTKIKQAIDIGVSNLKKL